MSYGPQDPVPVVSQNHEAIIIEMMPNNFIIEKVYIDLENSVDILYNGTFEQMRLGDDKVALV